MAKKRPWELLNIAVLIREHGGKLKNKFLLFKKARKFRSHGLLQNYSYNFMAEYEFSPDSTPIFSRKRAKGYLYPLLLCAPCKGGMQEADEEHALVSEDLAMVVVENGSEDQPETEEESEDSVDETDCIDLKAEQFIARFYREMKLQRQISQLQFTEMLDRGCG